VPAAQEFDKSHSRMSVQIRETLAEVQGGQLREHSPAAERLVAMRRIALVFVLLLAACSASGREGGDGTPGVGNHQEVRMTRVGAPTFGPGILKTGDLVRCGPDGVAAAVPARGEGVNGVFDGRRSSTIDIVHRKNGVVVVRCSL
jgi:hypothetical protein